MKKFTTFCLFVMSLSFSSMLFAATEPHHGGKGKFMAFFDSNSDGNVAMAEFNEAAAKRFRKMDADGDGVVTRDDFKSYSVQRRQEYRKKHFQKIDTNQDHQLSKEEYIVYKQRKSENRFLGMDRNKDGTVSTEEFSTDKGRWSGKNAIHPHHGKQWIFTKLDRDGDGKVNQEESLAAWVDWFNRIDRNNDQIVTNDEVKQFRRNKRN